MKLVQLLLGTGLLALLAGPASAQEQDKEALRKKILQEVEKRIRQEEERLLKEIERIIDEELSRPKKPVPPEPPKPPPPPAPNKVRGYLGIRAADLDAEERKSLGIKGGFRIQEVMPGSPADKGGLKAEDVVVAIDGRAVDAAQDVRIVVAAAGAGATLSLDILRDGKKQTVKVVLGRPPEESPEPEPPGKVEKKPAPPKSDPPKPEPKAKKDPTFDQLLALDEETFNQLKGTFEPLGVDLGEYFEKGSDGKYRMKGDFAQMFKDFQKLYKAEPEEEPEEEAPKKAAPKAAARPWLGVQPEELSEELRSQLDVEKGEGLLVADVVAGSPAEKAGLRKHDILLKIGGKPVKGEESLARFMEGARVGQEVTLTVLRKSKELALKVTLAERKE
jgi:C-terminal processing protease CtpA/Prc